MNFIDKKKINKYVVAVVLFLSFGYAQWQTARGTLAYLSYTNTGLRHTSWLFNDVVALLMGGAVPMLLYELITAFSAKFISERAGATAYDMKYALRFFYIAANIVIGSLKFLYFITPLMSVFFGIVADFVITTVFFALFLVYCARRYVPKVSWGIMCLMTGGTYLAVQTVLIVLNLIMAVVI